MPATPDKQHFIRSESGGDWFATDLSLYHCEFDREGYSDPLFAQLAVPFPESLAKAVGKRRAEFLAGRYCAQQSLQNLGMKPVELAIGKHRNPLWPQATIGSISHCGSRAVAIAGNSAQALGVGIDIEDEIARDTVAKIQGQILNQAELALLAQTAKEQHSAETNRLFTLAFSLKESFFKAAYPTVQDYFDFDAVSLVAIDWQARRISLRINHNLHQKLGRDMQVEGAFHLLPDNKVVTLVILNH